MSAVPNVDIIGNILDKCKRWQLRTIFFIYLTKIPTAFFMACIVYTAPSPKRVEVFCKDTTVSDTQWSMIVHPPIIEFHDKEFDLDYCDTYADVKEHTWMYFGSKPHEMPWLKPNNMIILNDTNTALTGEEMIPCDVFDPYSGEPLTTYDVICSRGSLIILTQGIHLVGIFLSGIVARYSMKLISPKKVFLLAMTLQIVCGVIAGIVESFAVHLIFRCLAAIGCAAAFTAGAAIFSDITNGDLKIATLALFDIFWSIGILILSVITQYESRWKELYLIISFPTLLIIFLSLWIPDSPRWHLKHDNLEEVEKILVQAVQSSTEPLPKDLSIQLKLQAMHLKSEPEPTNWISLWRDSPLISLRIFSLHVAWSCFTIMYFGMVLNMRNYDKLNLPRSARYLAVSEMIGCVIGCLLALKSKQKFMLSGISNIFGAGIALCIWIFDTRESELVHNGLLLYFVLVLKFSVSCSYAVLSACTVDLVSKSKKLILPFSGVLCGRLWLHIAPVIVALGAPFGEYLSVTVFAVLGAVGGLSMILIDASMNIKSLKK